LTSVAAPQPLRLKVSIGSVAAGATHTLALTTKGEVLAWGSNHHGQLAQEQRAYSALPLSVQLPERIQVVVAGMHFSLALGESGKVYAWGWNGQGQLGLNDTEDRYHANRVPGLQQVRSIAAGETHAVALTPGRLFGWGNNAGGQIGEVSRQPLHPVPFFPLG
jgi:alpha-tubulin suppressor-like RCC1 family protein